MSKDEAKWAYWSKQIEGWQSSGLWRNAYCKREGLKPTTLLIWDGPGMWLGARRLHCGRFI